MSNKHKQVRKVLAGTLGAGLLFSAFGSASAATENLSNHWAGDQLQRWAATGYLSGYADGTLKPDLTITRAEFISLVNRNFVVTGADAAVTDDTYGSGFTDLPSSHWAYDAMMKAVNAGFIGGYADRTIKPNAVVTRQEAAAILAKATGWAPGSASSLTRFSDYDDIASWSRASVAAAISQDAMSGYPDGTFQPTKGLTRAEAIVIIDAASGFNLDGSSTVTPGGPSTGVIDDTYSEDNSGVVTPPEEEETPVTEVDSDDTTAPEDTVDETETTDDATTPENTEDNADREDAANESAVAAPSVDPVKAGDSTIQGTAEAGSIIRVYSGNTLLSSITARPDGSFSVLVGTQPEGVELTVYAEDVDGNESEHLTITVLDEDGNAPDDTEADVTTDSFEEQ